MIAKRFFVWLMLALLALPGQVWADFAKQMLVPESDISWAQTFNRTGGETSYTILSDGDDATYVSSTTPLAKVGVELVNPAATDYPVGVRTWIRAKWYDSSHYKIKVVVGGVGSTAGDFVALDDEFRWYYYEAYVNPVGPAAWDWTAVNGARVFVELDGASIAGGIISEAYAEVITSEDAADAHYATGPKFVSKEDTIWAQAQIVSDGTIAFRYDMDENVVKAGGGTTTAAVAVTSATDYATTAEISGLDADTTYYFDILIDGKSQYALDSDNVYWSSLPRCTTAPAPLSQANFSFILAADLHGYAATESFYSMADKSPAFMLFVGDFNDIDTDALATIKTKYRQRSGPQCTSAGMWSNFYSQMPWFSAWDDHDGPGNNSHKIGTGGYTAVTWKNGYNNYDEYAFNVPFPGLSSPVELTGSADAGGDTDTLVDAGVDFTDGVYQGQVIYNLTDGQYALVESVTDTTHIETTVLTGGASWDAADSYRIKRSGIWYKFTWGNAEFFVIDPHYKSDPNLLPGCDLLDGTSYGSLPKDSGTTTATTALKLTQTGQNFLTTVHVGDVVKNTTDMAYALVTAIDSDTTLSIATDIMTSGETFEIYESGASEHGSKIANEAAGHIQREWLIDGMNNSQAKFKFLVSGHSLKYDEWAAGEQWADRDPLDAQLNYLQNKITAMPVIVLSGDRHFPTLDDGVYDNDKWPQVICGHNNDNSVMGINGEYAVQGFTSASNISGGSFSVISVGDSSVNVTTYSADGNIVSIGNFPMSMTVTDGQKLYFSAVAQDGGNGTRPYPYTAWTDYVWTGYNLRSGAEIYLQGAMGTLDLSWLTDAGAKTVKAWPRRSGTITGFVGGPNDTIELVGQPGNVFKGAFQ